MTSDDRTANSPRLLKAALGRRGSSIEGQLTGAAVDSQSRPEPALGDSPVAGNGINLSGQWTIANVFIPAESAVSADEGDESPYDLHHYM
jgi:hypothetical protein